MCFSKARRQPAILVGMCGTLILLVGMLMIFLSFRFQNMAQIDEKFDDEGGFDFRRESVTVLMVIASITTILGVCGVSQMCIQHRGCVIMFGCFLLPAWMLTLSFGFFLFLTSNSSMSLIQQFCDNVDMQSEYISEYRASVQDLDDIVGDLITERMCSSECPCLDGEYKDYWFNMEEAVLNSYGRTKSSVATDFLTPLDFTGSPETSYSTFAECFVDITTRQAPSQPQTDAEKYAAAIEDGTLQFALDFTSYFEAEYECSGLCSPALFYYSLPLEQGKPRQPCLLNLKEEVSNNLSYYGIACFWVGVIMLVTWLTQYCLWKKFEYN